MGAVATDDSEDLEALFDQIASERSKADDASPSRGAQVEAPVQHEVDADHGGVHQEPYDIFHRVGQLTRNLHDALRELGYDKSLDSAVGKLPDARARLSYIANLTGQAAEKTLSKAEAGAGIQQQVEAQTRALATRWDEVFAGRMGAEEFKQLAHETRDFMAALPQRTAESASLFTDIMLAQDFHDLTGQVICKVVELAQGLEGQLLKLLVEATPEPQRSMIEPGWLNGPAMNVAQRSDVVTDQSQVDDLLESLGF